jgi:hypothetical protein
VTVISVCRQPTAPHKNSLLTGTADCSCLQRDPSQFPSAGCCSGLCDVISKSAALVLCHNNSQKLQTCQSLEQPPVDLRELVAVQIPVANALGKHKTQISLFLAVTHRDCKMVSPSNVPRLTPVKRLLLRSLQQTKVMLVMAASVCPFVQNTQTHAVTHK